MATKTPITVAYGDGIGPEIMAACLQIFEEAGAEIETDVIEIGEKVYLRGISAGIEPSAIESLTRTKVFFKAPITTPQGGGFKSLNVTTRKMLGLYANIRPCVSYAPYVDTKHPVMDVVIVRENEEDTYGGIEHRQSDEVHQCLKLITRSGCERIVRYAFEYAIANNRKKVTCFTKDNIMKLTDGLFHKVFDEIATEYPQIPNEHWIVDIGAAKLADTPEVFDVLVMPNLYGDILSDVAAQIAGSVGLAGSANIGMKYAMFEAIHGSAPRRAGQNLANPSGLLLGGVMMLNHIGESETASRVHNAWLRTIEEGVHTYDIYKEGISTEKVGTKEFAAAVVKRMGKLPEKLKPVAYKQFKPMDLKSAATRTPSVKARVGLDVFVGWSKAPDELAGILKNAEGDGMKLDMLANRGTKVWPDGFPDTICTDVFRCRFMKNDGEVSHADAMAHLTRVGGTGLDVVKFESLYTFDGKPGFSLGQGQ